MLFLLYAVSIMCCFSYVLFLRQFYIDFCHFCNYVMECDLLLKRYINDCTVYFFTCSHARTHARTHMSDDVP
jgi:hypothetical protein